MQYAPTILAMTSNQAHYVIAKNETIRKSAVGQPLRLPSFTVAMNGKWGGVRQKGRGQAPPLRWLFPQIENPCVAFAFGGGDVAGGVALCTARYPHAVTGSVRGYGRAYFVACAAPAFVVVELVG